MKNNFKKFELKFDKKDFIIIFIITAIYAVVAFTNLGALEVPQKGGILNEDITVEFEGEEQISTAVFYNSIGQGECEFYYKAPNGDYSQIYDIDGNKQTFSYVNSMMYVWQPVDLYVKTDSIKISVKTPGMNVLEMAFFNENGERIEIKSVSGNGGNTQFLYDEQNLALYDGTYLDEMYFDEIYHARTAYENIHGMQPYEITHPPLGKIILSIGINIFGMVPFGWRFMGTLFGVLMLPLFYIIGKMLFKKHFYAGVMTALFAADFMHFAQTRIATIDSYSVFFILLMFLFMLWYTKTNYNRQPLKETLLPLFLCGISFGLGAATKWLCIYSGAGLAVIFIGIQIKRKFEYDRLLQGGEKVCSYKSNLIKTILWCVLFFIIIPLCIYFASYTPYTTVTQGSAYTFSDVIENQKYMLNYHEYLVVDHPHPFASEWYTWIFDIRPVLFYSNSTAIVVSTLSTMGNPFVWWGGIGAVIAVIILCGNKKFAKNDLFVVAVMGLSQIVPWMFITREVFIYHYFATVPFLIMIIMYLLRFINEKFKYGKFAVLGYVGLCIFAFAVFYPVISGTPVAYAWANGLRWLASWPFY